MDESALKELRFRYVTALRAYAAVSTENIEAALKGKQPSSEWVQAERIAFAAVEAIRLQLIAALVAPLSNYH